MKLDFSTTLTLVALLPAVNAHFLVYKQGVGGTGIAGNAWGYQVYDSEANCDNVIDWIWENSKDVSGGKYGVRCDGADSCKDPAGITAMEFAFTYDQYHWTTYGDRDWGLFDTNNNLVGRCQPATSPFPDFSCGLDPFGRAEGLHQMTCFIDGVSAADIRSHRP